MCGLCGVFHLDSNKNVEHYVIDRMAGTMLHRGPDGGGSYLKGQVGLGHRRLKIIDLESGAQPLANEDGSVVVVYNGEIYNFVDLKSELEEKGHRFQSRCDTEVIVHAYEEYGVACLDKFRGIFAFALYDEKKRRVFLARDRLGIKPLYYYVDNQSIYFASEVKAILEGLAIRSSVSLEALDFYLSLGYVPGEQTLFAGVKKLLPGHYGVIENRQLTIRKYWDIQSPVALDIDFATAKKKLELLLAESIELQLLSDVPLGAFLSGGLDSSSVVNFMSRAMNTPVKTFAVGYQDDPESSELRYARKMAEHLHTEHYEYILEPENFFSSLETLIQYAEEPVVDSAAIPLFRLAQLAREHVTVILSGEGGDEILAGYQLYPLMRTLDNIQSAVRYLPPQLCEFIAKRLAPCEKRAKYWDWARLPLSQRYKGISHDATDSIKKRMYGEQSILGETNVVQRYFEQLFSALEDGSALRRMSYVDLKTWLPDDLLLKADKMTMANSLELRVPLLDHKLVEFCLSLPDQFRLHAWEGKYLLKKVMEPYLPHEIVYRKKKGFSVPITRWFASDLYKQIEEVLLESVSIKRGYFRRSYVESVLHRHRNGVEDLSRRIFSFLVLEMWHRRFID